MKITVQEEAVHNIRLSDLQPGDCFYLRDNPKCNLNKTHYFMKIDAKFGPADKNRCYLSLNDFSLWMLEHHEVVLLDSELILSKK